MVLNIKDIKILHELDNNARISYSNLSKKVGLSREVVQYRLKKLIDKKYIKWFTILIDTSKLGYDTYQFYIKFERATEEKEKKLLNSLIQDKRVNYIVILSGNYDLMIEYSSKNPKEAHQFINEIKERFNIIKKINFGIIIKELVPNNKVITNCKEFVLFNKNTDYKNKSTDLYRFSESEIKLDKEDKLILYYLSENCRIKYIDLAKKLNISIDKITYKISNLIKNKIIRSFKTIYDCSKFDFQQNAILFQLESSDTKTKEFLDYLKAHKNVEYVLETIGGWDVSIDINSKNPEDFRKILMDIKNKFSNIIQNETILLIHEELKNNYLPPDCYPTN